MKKTKKVQESLLHKLNIPKRDTMPILTNAKSESGYLVSTDLEVTLFTHTELPAGMYKTVGKNLVRSMADPNQFPNVMTPLSNFDKKISFTTDNKEVLESLVDAGKFCSKELNRPIFTGISFIVTPGKLEIAATDGKAIYQKVFNVVTSNVHKGDIIDFIVKPQAFNILLKDKYNNDNLTVYIERNRVMITNNNIIILSHLIEGRYPAWRKAINAYTEKEVIIDRREWITALKEIKPFINKLDTKRVNLAAAGTDIILSGKDTEREIEIELTVSGEVVGTGKCTTANLDNFVLLMPLRRYADKECKIVEPETKEFILSLNHPYLDRILKAASSDKLLVRYLNSRSMLLFIEI